MILLDNNTADVPRRILQHLFHFSDDHDTSWWSEQWQSQTSDAGCVSLSSFLDNLPFVLHHMAPVAPAAG